MKADAIVAYALTAIVGVILLSNTSIRCAWMDCSAPRPVDGDALQVWKEVVLVILGALSGFIARGANNNG